MSGSKPGGIAPGGKPLPVVMPPAPQSQGSGLRTNGSKNATKKQSRSVPSPEAEAAAVEQGQQASKQMAATPAQGPMPAPPPGNSGISPGKLVTLEGKFSTPEVVLKPVDMLRQVQDGTLIAKAPMVDGTDLGVVSIRPGTYAVAEVVIEDGKVDRKRTEIRFETGEGRDSDLDGPLWWNADRIYIEDGQIFADVPCYPDPNITERLLGEGITEVPEDPVKFLALLSGGADLDKRVLNPRSISLDAAGAAVAKTGETPRVGEGTSNDLPLDLSGLRTEFSGTMKGGSISFGTGTQLTVRPNSPVTITGPITDLDISLDIESVLLQSEGTITEGTHGRLQMSVRQPEATGESEADLEVEVSSLALDRLSIETPGGKNKHRLVAHDVETTSQPDEPSLIRIRATEEGENAVQLHLAAVRMHDVSGDLQATDTHGQPTTLSIGRSESTPGRPAMHIDATLTYDSEAKLFTFDSHAEHFTATASALGLVDIENFDLDIADAALTGSGQVTLRQEGDAVSLNLVADKNSEWALVAHVSDAHIGADTPALGVVADIGSTTAGDVRLRTLLLSNQGMPKFDGSAEFQVTLDSLDVPLPGRNRFSLRPGTRGRLLINSMSSPGADSAAVDAKLILDLGADVVVTPGEIPGLEGARIAVDVDTGKTQLILDITLHPDGRLEAACGVHLHEVGLRHRLTNEHDGAVPEVSVPKTALPTPESFELAEVTPLPKVRPKAAHPGESTEIERPTLPQVRVRPGDIFRSVSHSTVRATIPMSAVSNIPVGDLDETCEVNVRGSSDKQGYEAQFDLSREQGNIEPHLVLRGGQVVPGESRLLIDPGLTVRVQTRTHVPLSSLEVPVTIYPTITSIRIERDPETGMGYLRPNIDHPLMAVAHLSGTADNLERMVGEKISLAVFGQRQIPLDSADVMAMLEQRFPQLAEEVVIGGEDLEEISPAPESIAAPDLAASMSPSPVPEGPSQALFEALNFSEAELTVEDAVFRPVGSARHLKLGNGQQITFDPDTELAISGTPDNFTLEGTAGIGGVVLGNSEVGGTLDHGSARVRIHVQRGADGAPDRVEVEVSELVGGGLNFSSQLGGATTAVQVDEISGGYIAVVYDGENTTVSVDLPEQTTAQLVGGGAASKKGYEGSANSITGEVTGTLSLNNGRISGEFSKVDIAASGVAFGSNSETTEAGRISLHGAARLETDDRGVVHLVATGTEAPLTLDTDLTLSTGAQIAITGGSASRVSFDPKLQGVTFSGVDAEVTGKIPIIDSGDPATDSILDIRSGRFRGSLRIDSDGVTTVGAAAFSELDGSITNLNNMGAGKTDIDLRQTDLEGSGHLRLMPDGWELTGDKRIDLRKVETTDGPVTERPDGTRHVYADGLQHPVKTVAQITKGLEPGWYQRTTDGALFAVERRSTLTAKAIASDMQFTTASPDLVFDMADGSLLTFDVDKMARRTDGSLRMDLRHGEMSGALDSGTVTVGKPGDLLERIEIRGTEDRPARVWAQVAHMSVATGQYSGEQETAFEIDAALRVEGRVQDSPQRLPDALQLPGSRIQLDKVEMGFNFQLMLGIHFDHGSFAASTHTLLDDDSSGAAAIRMNLSGSVDSEAAVAGAMNMLFDEEEHEPAAPE